MEFKIIKTAKTEDKKVEIYLVETSKGFSSIQYLSDRWSITRPMFTKFKDEALKWLKDEIKAYKKLDDKTLLTIKADNKDTQRINRYIKNNLHVMENDDLKDVRF